MTLSGGEAAVELRKTTARQRCGFKGPRAAEWLSARGIPVPVAPNTWTSMQGYSSQSGSSAAGSGIGSRAARVPSDAAALGDGLLVARLGTTEFFLEDRADGLIGNGDAGREGYQSADAAATDGGPSGGPPFRDDGPAGLRLGDDPLGGPAAGVYPVLRSDAGFVLSGRGSFDVLAQVCNVNFADLPPATNTVIMTLMIGVSVLVIPQVVNGEPQFLIWCDPTFGAYLEESLEKVVRAMVQSDGQGQEGSM